MILNESTGFNFDSAFDAYFTANRSYKDYAAEVGDEDGSEAAALLED